MRKIRYGCLIMVITLMLLTCNSCNVGTNMVPQEVESSEVGSIADSSFSSPENENNVKKLRVGASLNDVMEADPDGHYDFLYAGWSEYPKVSYHFFESGAGYMIQYDDKNIVSHIVMFDISNHI